MKFNINDDVRVKLNENGWDIHKKYWLPYCSGNYTPPKADADGYVKFQLWDFMNIYGPHMVMGLPIPFDPYIII
jgi:hypothetical protein